MLSLVSFLKRPKCPAANAKKSKVSWLLGGNVTETSGGLPRLQVVAGPTKTINVSVRE